MVDFGEFSPYRRDMGNMLETTGRNAISLHHLKDLSVRVRDAFQRNHTMEDVRRELIVAIGMTAAEAEAQIAKVRQRMNS